MIPGHPVKLIGEEWEINFIWWEIVCCHKDTVVSLNNVSYLGGKAIRVAVG